MPSPLLALLAAAAAHGPTADGGPPSRRPDVLVIVVDDAGFEDYAAAPTANINAFAAAGRVYTRFYTTPLCSPSRYQLHFGRYSHRALIGSSVAPGGTAGAATEDLSIAERLAAEGYATALFGKWHLSGKDQPIQLREAARVHGYQTWRAGSIGNVPNDGSHYAWERVDDGGLTIESRYTTLAVTEELEAWWQATAGPRFAVCSFMAPHQPYELPPAELVPDVPGAVLSDRERYEWALRGVDAAVARLATTLELDDAYVFLLPDNGTPQNVPPEPFPLSKGYKLSPFEGGIRVPLVVWGPDVAPGVDAALVQIADLPATILELTASAGPGIGDSISFAPTLSGGAGARTAVWSQRFAPNGAPTGSLTLDAWAVVRADGAKLLFADQPLAPPGSIQPELYDLSVDPWEASPLADPALEAELEALRAAFLGPDWPYPL